MLEKVEIVDDRLTPYLKRIRAGSRQAFYKPGNRSLQTEDADYFLDPPEPHIYAELIDGKWYWVNGCDECHGREGSWITYIKCEKHDVCCSCKTPRKELKDIPWGHPKGFKCKPCADTEHNIEKALALGKAAAKVYDEWDYMNLDTLTCPHCDLEINEYWEMGLGDESEQEKVECPRCDNIFYVSCHTSIQFTCSRSLEE